MVTATLTASSRDNPYVQHPYVAQSFEVGPNNEWIEFHLNARAKFHDGIPVTADDVVFTFNTIMAEGSPRYKQYYKSVKRAEKTGPRSVKFVFSEKNNRELPVIISQLPVLPEHWWKNRDFSKPGLEPPLGCGPYKIKDFHPGYSIDYERVKGWWGEHLAVNKGRYNFDAIRYDYYRDRTVAGEAFRSGEFDYLIETTAKNWINDYKGPAFDKDLIRRLELRHSRNAGMSGFFFNTRRSLFQDRRVRQALALVFDFEWTNAALFHNQYKRCDSFFSNSDLSATGLPDEREQAILEPWKNELSTEIFTIAFIPPHGDGSGRIRQRIGTAMELLNQAGWTLRDGVLRNKDGKPFAFELLLRSGSLERVALPFRHNLQRIGIHMDIALADTSRYIRRTRDHDYDMIYTTVPQSDHPGNEQRNYWTSKTVHTLGSSNWAGVTSPVVDALVDRIIASADRDELMANTRALDRVLLWGNYVIPGWYTPVDRVAYWDKFGMPKAKPKRGVDLFSWWVDKKKEQRIAESGFRSEEAKP
ncbi:extracellular solute-binding protein [Salidesulfovibrio onnuriiensis]|uniref:extracellular solute-binding protein n=1 Tax=Salidesulfovibrio onnuriiensis TaxID=2583823 RepID=UPI00164F05C9|nr:extracellular solute-binding protein [Salidesulfovibrio onnuriiensis]